MFYDILKRVWFLWALCLIFNIITLLLIVYKIHPSGKILALHYNVILGVDWYGPGNNLYQIPAAGFFITLLNFIFFKNFKPTEMFYAGLIPGATLVVQVILLFATVLLIRVN
jgi:hypothetical protein